MNPKQRLMEVKGELKALRASIATAKDEELDGIQTQIETLETEKRSLEKRISMLNAAQRSAMTETDDEEDGEDADGDDEEEDEVPQVRAIHKIASNDSGNKSKRAAIEAQKRAKMAEDWKKHRTVVLDSTVLIPKKQSTNLVGYPYNQIPSILDAVGYLDVINGETYEEPYIVSTGMADYTDQPSAAGTGGEYHEVGLEWDTVVVTKTKITAYSEITKELEKTPAANYAGAVEGNITVSLRKKLAREVVVGDGATGHFVGLMSNKVKENTVADYNLGVINENTLDELILNYGGEEDIESQMAILLNKLTLLEFSRVRGSDKRKVYNINYAAGTIDGIRFFTTSHVKAFDTAATGDAFLAYGDFNKYRVAVFSNIETAKSTDYKFRQGITAFRGDVFMGGNIVGYKSFIRVFKAASSVTKLTLKTTV
jgi:HK97 family phage major capsid protein